MSTVHHRRVEQLNHLERRLFTELAAKPHLLSPWQTDVLRYAFSFARLGQLRVENGDVDLFEYVAPFRHWFVDQLDYLANARRRASVLHPIVREDYDWHGIARLIDSLHQRLDESRTHLLQSHTTEFSELRLEEEICNRKLILVLGGGGGSGYPHLGTFAVISEMGLTPSMIVGSSMGSLLGLFRSIQLDFDPGATVMGLPRPSEFRKVFSPYRGISRFGFPGAFELKMRPIATEIFNTLLGQPIPRLNETPIALRPVVTGLRTGIGLALSEVEREISRSERSLSPVRISRRIRLVFETVRLMLQNPRFLGEVVFGSDEGLQDADVVDAVGFSCAVPGFIHYDIFRKDSETAPKLREIFQDRGFFRLTDGGAIANVPARIAWDCVQRGEIRSRNSFILTFDAFAPQFNLNAPFYPIQQLIGASNAEHLRYSDHHIAYRSPPSPVKLLQSFDTLRHVIAQTRLQMQPDKPFIELMTRRVPRWNQLKP